MNNIDIIKKNKDLNKFIETHKLSDDFISENYNSFLRALDSLDRCNNCQGLYQCRQSTTGQIISLDYQGVLVEEIDYCKYKKYQQAKDNLVNNYVYCNVASTLLDVDLDNVEYTNEQQELYALLLGILHKKKNKGLYIVGDLGVGKTYLCSALANSLVKKGEKVAYVKVSTFFNEMKSYVTGNSVSLDKMINKLKSVDYLFFDDIGSETVSEFVRDDILFNILDYRLDNKLITIFNSNLNLEELFKHYQYDRKEKSNMMNAKRLIERIDILTDTYVLQGPNLRRKNDA